MTTEDTFNNKKNYEEHLRYYLKPFSAHSEKFNFKYF